MPKTKKLPFKLTAWLLLAGLLGWGCSSSTIEPPANRLGYDYFPVAQGQYRTYQVQEIIYTPIDPPETLRYDLRESVGNLLAVNGTDSTFLLQRETRQNAIDAWQVDSVWSITRTANQAIVQQSNRRVLKLVFPVAQGKRWNGNLLNALPADTFEIRGLAAAATAGDTVFNNTLTVFQNFNLDTVINQDKRFEVYAQNVGLVRKEQKKLQFCEDADCIGTFEIVQGAVLEQILVDYGEDL